MTFKKKLTKFQISECARPASTRYEPATRISQAAWVLPFLVLFSAQLLAQPKIILQTTPTPTEIPLQASSNVIIDPLTGDITATPDDPAACTGTGSGDCDAQVDVISFNINPSTVSQGQTFTATFSQRGAWECERTGLPGTTWNTSWTTPGSGQLSVIVGSAVDPNSYTLTLTCRNGTSGGDAIDSLSRTLVVNASSGGGTPQSCIDEGRLPPSSWSRERNAKADQTSLITETWTSMFGGTAFPLGDAVNMRIRTNRYGAFFFNTGTTGQSGQVNFADLTGNIIGVRTAPAIVSMSPCPGDFLPQSGNAAKCRLTSVGAVNPSFQWTRINGESNFRCLLPANAEFYYNVSYVSGATQNSTNPENFDWQCSLSEPTLPCGHRMTTNFTQ